MGTKPAIGSSLFICGDRVSVRGNILNKHNRTPGYIKNKVGLVKSILGQFRNPESLAYGDSGLPKIVLYQIEFNQTEVWDDYDGSPHDKLYVDIYEHWLIMVRRSQNE